MVATGTKALEMKVSGNSHTSPAEVAASGLRRPTLHDVFLSLTGHVTESDEGEDDEENPDGETAADAGARRGASRKKARV